MAVVILHCGKKYHHVSPWVDQYRQSVGDKFSDTQVTGYPIVLFSQSNYRAMWNWSNNCWWGHNGKSIFRVIFSCGRTLYHSLRAKLVSDIHRPNKKWSYNVFISCSVLFYQISLGQISWHMTCFSPRCPLRSHYLVCIENHLFIVGIGIILNKEIWFIFRYDCSDCTCFYS